MRNFLILTVVWTALFFAMPLAIAQDVASGETSAAEPVSVTETAPEVTAETPAAVGITPETLLDLKVREALQAREAADQALVDAVIAAQAKDSKTVTTPNGEDQTRSPNAKSSLIPKNADEAKAMAEKVINTVLGWLKSPAFLAQVAAIVAAYLLSPIIAAGMRKRIRLLKEPPAKDAKLRLIKDYVFQASRLLRAIILVILLAVFAIVLKAAPPLGQDWLVKLAQSLAVVFLVYRAIKQFISNELYQKVAIWILIPLAILVVFGYFDDLKAVLNGTELMEIGDKPITAMTIILLVIFGALFFRLGSIANSRGQNAIRAQEGLDASTREVVAKIFQILLFTIVFIMVLSAAKVPLSGLVVIFSALSLGIGLGLQPIASNFVSGLIILFDRSVKVGDYVVLPDGQEGFVEAINMRSTTVETTDGKDIMVPNTQFTEEAYENWTHKDPRQRYEVHFTVAYSTDLDSLEGILIPAVLKHPQVLTDPEMPDLEFRAFGEYGAEMAIEFWSEGIDDGPNKFTSDLNFIVWRTLKAHNIVIPFPQREVRNLT